MQNVSVKFVDGLVGFNLSITPQHFDDDPDVKIISSVVISVVYNPALVRKVFTIEILLEDGDCLVMAEVCYLVTNEIYQWLQSLHPTLSSHVSAELCSNS